MELAPAQLEALVAIADHGTFDAAARHLHVTASAISQRIRALESDVGQVVVRRTTPCRPTPAGEELIRLARQTRLLQEEVRDALAHGHLGTVDLPVAVSADSLATWFRAALADVADWPDVALRLHVEDQAFSADLLRSGDVLAAVTSEPAPVQGCSVEPLGHLRYVPAAAPTVAERWRRGRGPDWAAMPMVVFNEKDLLQHELLAARGVAEPPVVHRVPTSADFLESVCLGLGWGMIPLPQLTASVEQGRLVPLGSRLHVDVPLHWQRWRLDSPVLDRLTEVVRRAAGALK
ncbi:LysR family transcriptional regulator [Nocardioides sp. Root1257]|uniref:LysR family transcriptional regulator ArgP n=1 Tax=unclassified Nocardioides TaxID=2615069 RepID=UPI0006FA1B50|nr:MULTISPECIES: LysR family transcriptional regulator ArgP [unclassified Nocardioides]KQW47907.1 LysR family transcriptional regulator [Nocardioides sp. Root1257]KRC45159.1 LysR family transcriptional regulator [Nocardioides sp. Root224]